MAALFDIEYGRHTDCYTNSTFVGYDGPQYGADRLLQQVLILNLDFFWEIPFLSLADDVICLFVCRTYLFLLMLKSWNSFPQPHRQCEHPRPVWLLVHLFLRVRALLQRVPVRDLPQGFDLGNKLLDIHYYSPSRRKSGPSSSLLPTTSCTTTSRRSWSSSTTTRSTILLEWKMSQLLHNLLSADIFFGKMFFELFANQQNSQHQYCPWFQIDFRQVIHVKNMFWINML